MHEAGKLAIRSIGSPWAAAGFAPLMLLQAATAFNHNLLRSALLTLVAFRGLTAFGLTSESVIAISTLLIVAPFVAVSILAGRFADTRSKKSLMVSVKGFGILVSAIAAFGLISGDIPVMLLAMLLAGLEAAFLGPAKFGILPELLPRASLMSANSWMSASNTAAILAGLILGNLLILQPSGPWLVAAGACLAALVGAAASLAVPQRPTGGPAKATGFLEDYRDSLAMLRRIPSVTIPIVGSSWFWFQGALNTAMFPLYVARSPEQPESLVSLLLLASMSGIAIGALGARSLGNSRVSRMAVTGVFLAIVVPGLDLWLVGPVADPAAVIRIVADVVLLSAATGFYFVPLNTALQTLTPAAERARFIGINHTANGLAMIGSGLAMLLLFGVGLNSAEVLAIVSLATGLVAAGSLLLTPELGLRAEAGDVLLGGQE